MFEYERAMRSSSLLNQRFGRDAKTFVQPPRLGHGQRALVIEYFLDAIGLTDVRHQIFDREIALLHHEFDGFHLHE